MSDNSTKPLLVSIVGPTAVGKTALAIKIATRFRTEILSADSRQFYEELVIGTAKPNSEELGAVKHHFIDSHSIEELYSAGDFGRDARQLITRLHQKNPIVVAVGGSSLYLKALWEGFDEMPEITPLIRTELNQAFQSDGLSNLLEELEESDPAYYAEVDRQNPQRVIRALEVIRSTGKPFSSFRKSKKQDLPYENLKIGLSIERELLFTRINARMDEMIANGLFEEVQGLIPFKNHNALQTVGYTEIFRYLDGEYDREEAMRLLKRNSRRYAKRQMTWFKRYEDVYWFEPNQEEEIVQLIRSQLP